jgi:hypothetical protein
MFLDCDLVPPLLQNGVFKIYKISSPPIYSGWEFFLSLWSLLHFNKFNNNGVQDLKVFSSITSLWRRFFYTYDLLRFFKIYISQNCCTHGSNVSISPSRLAHLNGILSTCSELNTINSYALRSLFVEYVINM